MNPAGPISQDVFDSLGTFRLMLGNLTEQFDRSAGDGTAELLPEPTLAVIKRIRTEAHALENAAVALGRAAGRVIQKHEGR
jgi:hypothetical protein